ncbi:hypothetical protein DQ04_15011000 [Trypanosoma grayi]|uniref:hypothetical protein n=1 Tax=Trypanosoma grayi TaxID=71804 RepID=UPI0004F4455D|nr:hypothetical protein DQ04_15011000 [Trypanosoma grayi]KEG06251.1 hypothetical protein DQ04_15011000 [Trypanosoma grayi]
MPSGGAAADTNESDGSAGSIPLTTETVEDKKDALGQHTEDAVPVETLPNGDVKTPSEAGAAGSSKVEADVKDTNVPLGGTNDGSTAAQHFAPLVLLAGACAAVLLVAS